MNKWVSHLSCMFLFFPFQFHLVIYADINIAYFVLPNFIQTQIVLIIPKTGNTLEVQGKHVCIVEEISASDETLYITDIASCFCSAAVWQFTFLVSDSFGTSQGCSCIVDALWGCLIALNLWRRFLALEDFWLVKSSAVTLYSLVSRTRCLKQNLQLHLGVVVQTAALYGLFSQGYRLIVFLFTSHST